MVYETARLNLQHEVTTETKIVLDGWRKDFPLEFILFFSMSCVLTSCLIQMHFLIAKTVMSYKRQAALWRLYSDGFIFFFFLMIC